MNLERNNFLCCGRIQSQGKPLGNNGGGTRLPQPFSEIKAGYSLVPRPLILSSGLETRATKLHALPAKLVSTPNPSQGPGVETS